MSLKLTSFIQGEVNCKNRKSGDTLKTLKIHQLKKLIFAIGTVLSKELPQNRIVRGAAKQLAQSQKKRQLKELMQNVDFSIKKLTRQQYVTKLRSKLT